MPSRDAWRKDSSIKSKLVEVYEERNGIPFPDGFNIGNMPCDLSKHRFENFVMLNGYFMPKGAIFDGSTFARGIKSQAGFWDGRLSLAKCIIGDDVDLQGSVFSDGMNCRSAKIMGSLQLADTKMLGDLILDGVKISKSLRAGRLEAKCVAYCQNAKIAKDADFSDAKFESSAYFDDTAFAGHASLIGTAFSQDVRFVLTKFSQGVNFTAATFNDDAVFRNTQFLGPADFSIAQFLGRADFTEAVFKSSPSKNMSTVRFEGAVFEKFTSFRKSKFVSDYPDFFGATLYERTGFTAEDDFWPSAHHEKCKEAKDSCAIIRHAVAKQSLPDEEHFFFRREMEFARQVEWANKDAGRPYFKAWPYWLFKVMSGYGESMARPIEWLCAVFGFGFGALLGHFAAASGIWTALRLSAAISFSNLLPLFGFGRTFLKDELEGLTAGLQFLSGAQTVLALPLLFFLGLGLRKRFRLR